MRKPNMKEVKPLMPETDADMIFELSRIMEEFFRMGCNYNKMRDIQDARKHWMENRNKWENV